MSRTWKRLGQARWVTFLLSRVLPPLDRALYRITRGRIVSAAGAVLPVLRLTTIGRTSGQERTAQLLYTRLDGRLLIVASNWGRAHHPAWSANLLADPSARVQIGSRVAPCRARLLDDEEKKRIWPRLLDTWPAYQAHTLHSAREVRVFELQPTEAPS